MDKYYDRLSEIKKDDDLERESYGEEEVTEDMKIRHVSHEHMLTFSREIVADWIECCEMTVHGPAYICESCKFALHKSCAELPIQITHALHHHNLTLLFKSDHEKLPLICNGCRHFCIGFVFNCRSCHFNLDVKCASSGDDFFSKHDGQTLNYKRETKTTISHFCHEHVLNVCNMRKEYNSVCAGCNLEILGLAYVCADCQFEIHESCMAIPKDILHPFHPQHVLFARAMRKHEGTYCNARGGEITGIKFNCSSCSFDIHVSCAKNPRSRALKHDSRDHNLFYFVENGFSCFNCTKCGRGCRGPFYRCLECKISLHVDCIPLPRLMRHKCHLH